MKFSFPTILVLSFFALFACTNGSAELKQQLAEENKQSVQLNTELDSKLQTVESSLQELSTQMKGSEDKLVKTNPNYMTFEDLRKHIQELTERLEAKKAESSKAKQYMGQGEDNLTDEIRMENTKIASNISKNSLAEIAELEVAISEAKVFFEEMTGKRPLENLK